jgi:DNA-directed RNA polymerase specialized sigma24 family protein
VADHQAAAAQSKAREFVAALPPNYQRVIILIYFEGHTAQQAADIIGVPKTTVDWRVREALRLMRADPA